SPGNAMREIEEREGVRTVAVPMERHISPFKDLKSLWGLIKVFRREKPAMVHSITPKAGLLSMMAAWFCRVPVRVHTFTGLVFPTATGLTQKILILTDRITCACATHVVPEGEGVRSDLINYRITKKPLRVLGHGNIRGIDLERYNPELPEVKAEASRIRKDGVFTFVFIGRLVGDKGINELVAAFARLNKECPSTRLILVGPQESNLDPLQPETLAEIEANKSIEAVGSQSDVRPWLVASDAFVFPSYREGFPNVVIEAGAMGLPSIVTDINGSREIIIEGENGTIIPSKSEAALYDAMYRFVTQADEIGKMASSARELIASRYEQGYVRRCLKEYYREILQK
ncbi:MAG: glycosyltransferase family 4 protein, partial [Muribaculaceae bacterium]|nr:glycosyltransferase family 4 protein [Muribaculaceae bacterium]